MWDHPAIRCNAALCLIKLDKRLVLDAEKVVLSLEDRERLIREIQHEVFGLGPLEPLLQDPSVNDVLMNGHDAWADSADRQNRRPFEAR